MRFGVYHPQGAAYFAAPYGHDVERLQIVGVELFAFGNALLHNEDVAPQPEGLIAEGAEHGNRQYRYLLQDFSPVFSIVFRDRVDGHSKALRRAKRRLRFHLNANPVQGLAGGIEHTACRLRGHVNDETTLSVPSLDGFHNVAIGRRDLTGRCYVVDRAFQLIEYEYGRPSMVMSGLLFLGFKDHFEYTKPIVFKEDLVVGRSRDHSIEAWVPIGGVVGVCDSLFHDAFLT